MTIIPVFSGKDQEDPVEYIKNFKRSCICNGFLTSSSWADLLPTFLDKTASKWYERQSIEIRRNWELLEKVLMNHFEVTESYQNLVASLGSLRQESEPYEDSRDYTERVRELCDNIKRSLAKGVSGITPEVTELQMQGVDHMVLRAYIAGYVPHIQQHLNYSNPSTLDDAAELAHR